MSNIRKIGVLTSGGDSPGMNAAIRAIVKSAHHSDIQVFGIKKGFSGLIQGDIHPLRLQNVSGIIQRGGTILKSARCPEFFHANHRLTAFNQLKGHQIDALIVIGGDGTFTGALEFSKEFPIPVVGLPGTIDNDLFGTDFTIGYDTALNTAVQVIDKIRDTADSHDRIFIIEVMGKDAGFIALRAGIAGGAEAILVPESTRDTDFLLDILDTGFRSDKQSLIIIVAEGDESGGAIQVQERIRIEYPQYETRTSILGHMQRGGTPSAMDRVLASRLGVEAVKALQTGQTQCMVGVIGGKIAYTPFEKSIKHNETLSPHLIELAEILSI